MYFYECASEAVHEIRMRGSFSARSRHPEYLRSSDTLENSAIRFTTAYVVFWRLEPRIKPYLNPVLPKHVIPDGRNVLSSVFFFSACEKIFHFVSVVPAWQRFTAGLRLLSPKGTSGLKTRFPTWTVLPSGLEKFNFPPSYSLSIPPLNTREFSLAYLNFYHRHALFLHLVPFFFTFQSISWV